MDSIYEDYKPYMDRWELVQPAPDDGRPFGMSGNGLLYTSSYILALVDNSALTSQEKIRLLNVYQSCQVPNEIGLYHRTPTKVKDFNSFDDLLGVLLASKYLDDGFMARRIYDRGQMIVSEVDESEGLDHPTVKLSKKILPILKFLTFNKVKWNYNNVNPDKFRVNTWLGRRIDVIATIQMAAKKRVNPIYWTYWMFTMLSAYLQGEKSDHNAFKLRYTSCRAIEGYGFFTDLTCRLFYARLRKVHGSLGELNVKYFNNPEHPDGKWLRNTR